MSNIFWKNQCHCVNIQHDVVSCNFAENWQIWLTSVLLQWGASKNCFWNWPKSPVNHFGSTCRRSRISTILPRQCVQITQQRQLSMSHSCNIWDLTSRSNRCLVSIAYSSGSKSNADNLIMSLSMPFGNLSSLLASGYIVATLQFWIHYLATSSRFYFIL